METGFRFECDDSCFIYLFIYLFFKIQKFHMRAFEVKIFLLKIAESIKLIIKLGNKGGFDLDEFAYGGKV